MILYEGPSLFDGAPIVAIATIDTENPKTGRMVQVWILHRDLHPCEATAQSADRAVCGGCPQRHSLDGGCYVIENNAPRAVWDAYHRGKYSDPEHIRRVQLDWQRTPVRLGAYGDPAAVPVSIWTELLQAATAGWTGYTHSWQLERVQPYRRFLMASCDHVQDVVQARSRGWRCFMVSSGNLTGGNHATPARMVECLNTKRGLTCADCRICDGTRFGSHPTATDVWIHVHGTHANKFVTLARCRGEIR